MQYLVNRAKSAQSAITADVALRSRVRAIKALENADRYARGDIQRDAYVISDADVDTALELVAQCVRLSDIAQHINTTTSVLTTLFASTRCRERYKRAKLAAADAAAAAATDIADRAEAGLIDSRAAKAAASVYQWLAERQAPSDWGARQVLDVNMQVDVAERLQQAAARVSRISNDVIEGELVTAPRVSVDDIL